MKLKESALCLSFISDINSYAMKLGATSLTAKQKYFVSFCVFSMIMLGSLNFSAFALASLGYYGDRALSWMFHHSKINWSLLLKGGVLKATAHKPEVNSCSGYKQGGLF